MRSRVQPPLAPEHAQHLGFELDYLIRADGVLRLSRTLRTVDGAQERVRVLSLPVRFGHGSWELGTKNLFYTVPENGSAPLRESMTVFPHRKLVEVPGDGTVWVTVEARPAAGKTWYDVRAEQDVVIRVTTSLTEP